MLYKVYSPYLQDCPILLIPGYGPMMQITEIYLHDTKNFLVDGCGDTYKMNNVDGMRTRLYLEIAGDQEANGSQRILDDNGVVLAIRRIGWNAHDWEGKYGADFRGRSSAGLDKIAAEIINRIRRF